MVERERLEHLALAERRRQLPEPVGLRDAVLHVLLVVRELLIRGPKLVGLRRELVLARGDLRLLRRLQGVVFIFEARI